MLRAVAAPAHSVQAQIGRIFSESVATKLRFLEENTQALSRVVSLIADAFRSGKKVLLFGNGGSAADAQHIAAEFTNRMLIERPPLPAIALTTDTSALTSIANDYGYADVFAKQVAALGQPGDVAIAISTSGNSPNVLAALRVCRDRKIHTVGLTGRDGGAMAREVDHLLNVSASTKTPRIQETHILVGHAICELVDDALFGTPRAGRTGAPSVAAPEPARVARGAGGRSRKTAAAPPPRTLQPAARRGRRARR
jgi:D-sedoheptulose 7-phosphate isomerase